ncbi:MAG: FkbM family methyltransferase [Chitinophagaceae bacterium]|nr:FkbM family methyltransferase [Chitinophagaceae bacterium]MCZ2397319.1 FkbM family methyltransferase [Chitinophagales bacterium]
MFRYNIRYRLNKWKEVEGIFIPVYLRYGYSVIRFIDNGTYECEELRLLNSKLENTDVVMELGTGIGFISAFCARKIGFERVYTFEANEQMKPVILQLFEKNKVHPHFQVALLGNDEKDETEFLAQKDFLASSEKRSSAKGDRIVVPVLDINETIKKIQPTYLVMDIEGNEYDVINAIRDFHTIRKIQFELHPDVLSDEQTTFIFKVLKDHHFIKDEMVCTERNFYFEKR